MSANVTPCTEEIRSQIFNPCVCAPRLHIIRVQALALVLYKVYGRGANRPISGIDQRIAHFHALASSRICAIIRGVMPAEYGPFNYTTVEAARIPWRQVAAAITDMLVVVDAAGHTVFFNAPLEQALA